MTQFPAVRQFHPLSSFFTLRTEGQITFYATTSSRHDQFETNHTF